MRVSGLSGIAAVAAGDCHSLALKSDGTVWAWGDNYYGALGDGSVTWSSPTPVQVSGMFGVVAVAGGWLHSLALRSDGTVWAWGYNSGGQLGNGTTIDSRTPVHVNGLLGVTAIADGFQFSLAVAVAPLISLNTGSITFGTRVMGVAWGPLPVTITNSGSSPLTVSALPFSTADFYSTTALPLTVPPGASAAVDVWFKPTAIGPLTGTMSIIDNSPTSPETVSLSGYGINPIASISPTSINFGNQQVNTISAASALTLTNTGVGVLTITGAALRGVNPEDFSFTLSPAPPVSLQPGQAVVFGVRFTPRFAGIRTATLQLFTNALNSAQSSFLTGNGILPADLAITMSAKVTPANPFLKTASSLVYTMQVTNTSPNGAYNAAVNSTISAGTTVVSAQTSQGSCKLVKDTVGASMTCSLGSLAGGGAVIVTLTTTYPGKIVSNTATVTSTLDPNSANNTATVP
jgi:uncharacterized repeat protein (TIGR01451 family)